MFKIHPTVPENMSNEAKDFIMSCFVPDPDDRATATELLNDCFLKSSSRKRIIPPKVSDSKDSSHSTDYYRSLSVPISILVEDTDSDTGSVDLASSLDMRKHLSPLRVTAISESPPCTSGFLSTPYDSSSDMSSPASSEENIGLFLLRKDSERRATLHRVLTDYISYVVTYLQESILQLDEGSTLSEDHIITLIACLRQNIRSPDRKQLATSLLELRSTLLAAAIPLNSLQTVLFNFQDAVKKVLKQQQVKPHWMFALDNLLRQAVQDAITVLLPELKLHLQLSFETEDSIPEEQSVDPDTPVALVPDQPMAPVDNRQAETGNENGTSARLGPPDKVLFDRNCTLSEKLKDMRVETRRLLTELSEKEREYQELLRASVLKKKEQIDELRKTFIIEESELNSTKLSNAETKSLVCWLQSVPVNQDTINKLLAHEFTLDCLLHMASRDDLVYCGLRGAMMCRLWTVITDRRKTPLNTSVKDSEDTRL
uniref:MAP3K HisK-N-like globin domain-containing protein n=2 Tax=Xiphophorus maculatus TaxID=8083 RepID=M4AKB2_XIPMA